ncbi:MAG: hypothetical protein ACYDA6_00570 [Solirubrobacteraceae bacterium]
MTPAEQGATGPGAPDGDAERELREAYEAEMRRISAVELVLQAAASLLNLGARRLGLGEAQGAERDLEQVRDAIDGVRGLLPVIERRLPAAELRPLRDALSQLQMTYAREAAADLDGARAGAPAQDGAAPPGADPGTGGAQSQRPEAEGSDGEAAPAEAPAPQGPGQGGGEDSGPGTPEPPGGRSRGPAESSGRLWVPGRD